MIGSVDMIRFFKKLQSMVISAISAKKILVTNDFVLTSMPSIDEVLGSHGIRMVFL
jgi:hypothetical protein